ncbi:PRC-barrel domain-containing protein [Arenibacter certesii]|uniref:Photosystem reaction center subunit H n=1 Tax=Arenibacter certesii TaxID=228955 RepID=A0A918MQC4_9FLAO|nr:PRC-barrel domain-containing protein [Arenibacter certesii]GGW45482.1 hypothetical protein GCM10007383_32340 [Arenibacter certesii]
MKTNEKHLYYLSELSDYKVDPNYTNVHGWPVKDAALRTIGTVTNLLVNKKTERVVYLDVEVDASIIDANHDPYRRSANLETREYINEEGENHIIIPIGLVDIDTVKKHVFTEIIDHQTFAETKRIRPNTIIEKDYESDVLNSFRRRYVEEPAVGTDNSFLDGIDEDQVPILKNGKEDIPIDKFDWYDAGNEAIEPPLESEEKDFYRHKQFDDSKFQNR